MSELQRHEGTDEAETLGARVLAHRKALGISQAKLAALAGTDRSRISRIETGEVAPTVTVLYKVARALGVEPGALLPRVLEPPKGPDPELVADLERYHDRARLRALRSGLHRMRREGATREEVEGVLRALGPGIEAGMFRPEGAAAIEEQIELAFVTETLAALVAECGARAGALELR